MAERVFDDKPAVRERVPLLLGLVGPSGGGKTYSALRLARGFQKVTGGDIHFIDTEARRVFHYADCSCPDTWLLVLRVARLPGSNRPFA